MQRRAVITLVVVAVLVGMTPAAGASTGRTTALRCPAPGEALDDAVSTAPLRHTPEALAVVRTVIESEITGPHGSPDAYSIGDNRDAVDVTDEPETRPYGIDFGIRDPFGNAIRIGQMSD